MNDPTIRSGSHRVTNDVIFELITSRITAEAQVLDFGAGLGHMCQRLGNYFSGQGRNPAEQLTPCEIEPEIFEYRPVPCRKIGVNSEIPVADGSQDLIYAIEVLEHVPRPYDFFLEASAKLKRGGFLIFSVPNALHLKSRLQFFLTGYADMFGPPSTEDKNAGRICGHIMPLSYPYFVYGLKRAGFLDVEFHPDRMKRSAFFLSVLFFPLLWLAAVINDRALKKYDDAVWRENRDLVWRVNRLDVLSSRSCIVVARKPGSTSGK
ncbi:MAG TPA: methyltransferase domain-containing protein [Verrucomicrobiae bacterium]|nr:methyltransferase domain-containing protein [Verrucomicrobiae bacterium]